MFVIGVLNGIDDLPAVNGADKGQAPLKRVSVEGFSILARPERITDDTPRAGMVKCLVQTHWKAGGGRPTFWLETIVPFDLVVA